MTKKDEEPAAPPTRFFAKAYNAAVHTGHRLEHPIHGGYFAALAFGYHELYVMAAGICMVLTIIIMLPELK